MRYKLPFTELSAGKISFTIYLSNLLWYMRGVSEEGIFKNLQFFAVSLDLLYFCSKLQSAAIYNISFI